MCENPASSPESFFMIKINLNLGFETVTAVRQETSNTGGQIVARTLSCQRLPFCPLLNPPGTVDAELDDLMLVRGNTPA
jgi:hypothetical protein